MLLSSPHAWLRPEVHKDGDLAENTAAKWKRARWHDTASHICSTITARTLIAHGDRDDCFPIEIPVEMYQSIPKAYLWIVPNGGHVPIEDHADEFTLQAMQFLSGNWNR